MRTWLILLTAACTVPGWAAPGWAAPGWAAPAPGEKAKPGTWQEILATLPAKALASSMSGTTGTTGTIETAGQGTCIVRDGMAILMAPNTPKAYIDYVRTSPEWGPTGPHRPRYAAGQYQWTHTATDGDVNGKRPITLTYSFVPDGTPININGSHSTETTGGSVLYSVLNFQFFTAFPDVWKYYFRHTFSDWGAQIGVHYVEVGDDGAPMGDNGSPGVLGQRGDIRIGGHHIDGPNGVLAYCYFPTTASGRGGDMVLDCDNNLFVSDYWADPANSYQKIRYVVGHEHGHGLGLDHVQPLDHTKLMEPIVNTNFTGPQDDDVRGARYLYGDMNEGNDDPAHATPLGAVRGAATVFNASVDGNGDADWYRIDLTGASRLSVQVAPFGATYPVGPDGGFPPATINTQAIMLLAVDVVAADGSTILGTAIAPSLGSPVSLANVTIPATNKWCYVNVYAESPGDVQRYNLSLYQYSSALYVDGKATGTMDGTPEHPYDKVSTAVNAAGPTIDTIFIRSGNYTDSFPNGIAKTLNLVNWDPAGIVQISSP